MFLIVVLSVSMDTFCIFLYTCALKKIYEKYFCFEVSNQQILHFVLKFFGILSAKLGFFIS